MRKKIILLFCVFSNFIFNNTSFSQCSAPCPPLLTISDSINCNNVEIRRVPVQGGGYSNNPFIIRACKNTRMKYTLNIDQTCYAGTTFSFVSITGGSFINLTGNIFVVQWGTAATGNVQIAFATPGGAGLPVCRDTLNISFNLVNTPIAAFTATPQPACFNNPTIINFNSSGTTNALNYFWNFGDSYTSTLANPSHAYASPGTYVVTLIVSNNTVFNGSSQCPTCVDSIKKTVVISNLPGPKIECVATVCAGATDTYCTNDVSCSGYLWTVTGGVITAGQNTPCVTVQWGSGNPQGTINLVATGCTTTYCPQGTTLNVPIIPTSGTITGATLVCNNTSEVYTLPSWPGTTYNWSLGSGGIINPFNTNTNQINIDWNTIGSHFITCNYFDSSLNCGGTAVYNVFVRPTLSITGPTSLCQNQTSNLNAIRPTNAPVPCNWTITPAGATINFGNGTNSINVTWTPGVYTVTAASVTPNFVCNNASYIVTVIAAPIISAINGADSICKGKTYVYSATSNATGLFNWNLNNAASFSNLGVNNDSIQVTWGNTGPYSISVSQIGIPSGCQSNTFIKNIFAYPTPIISGPINVCADNIETYTISNILNGNFNWYTTPSSFGTIISGQGTSTVQIKWHGNNNPGSSNVVYLHYGVCNSDSIAITINEPPLANITPSGTLCGPGGITLSTGATGTFSWTGPSGPIPGNTPSITNINTPGNYTVQIQNFNGTGCTVNTNYNIPDIGRPIAQISATNVLQYCLPNVPNMNLVAVNGPGYTFQWFQTPATPVGTGPVLPINTLTLAGTYSYYCVVTLGSCVVTSNTLTIVIQTCPPNTGCSAAINVTNITGCNPFTLTIAATAPLGATIVGTGNPTIQHLEDGYTIAGNTTRTYTSVGYKQVRICADVTLPNSSICRVCKDTVVNVTVAANFTKVVNCKSVSLFDASTVVFPAIINSFNWSVGSNPGNLAVPPVIANYNNSSIANPILNITQSGSYIITQAITSGSCTVIHRDTVNIIIPNASFNVSNSCVGTTVNLNNLFPSPTNFWDFGDAATSYTSPTFHAYGAPGLYAITHIVTLANGCRDTVINPIGIAPSPICTVTNSGPLTFCFNDSVILGSSCTGLVNFQWYNNGVPIPGQTFATDTIKQTGNYSFIAFDVNGCKVISDTVTVTVLQAPNVNINTSGSVCVGSNYTVSVPSCVGCAYQWLVDGNPVGNSSSFSAFAGTAPFTIGTHNIFVQVVNALGCTDTSSINVTFYALPTVSISVVGPTPYCSNNVYTLNATTSAASPTWAWTYNNIGFILSTTNSLIVSAAGNYTVKVTDGITGCSQTAIQNILPSPSLNLFPIGCDSICDTSKIFLPIPSLNGNLTGYNINWYNDAPIYGLPIANGISLPLNTLPLGNHNFSVIVTSPNGCQDTSNIYSVFIKSCNINLPIKDLKLTAKQIADIAILNWSTEQEINNDYFELEKSSNGLDFTFVSKTMSKGNNNSSQFYNYNDPITLYNQTIYYRLKIVDKNGRYEYSKIVKILPSKLMRETIDAIPTITSHSIDLYIHSNYNQKTNLIVYSTNGATVKTIPLRLIKGVNTLKINLSEIASGLYFLSVKTKEEQLVTKVLKN